MWKWIGVFLLLICPLTIFLLPVNHLEIRDRKEDRVIARKRVSDGQILTFSYIHSVERFPVVGLLRIEGRALRPIETRFPSYGAGLPNAPARAVGNGERKALEFKGESERMERFSFYVNRSTGPVVSIGEETIPLGESIREGGIGEIRIVRISPMHALFHRCRKALEDRRKGTRTGHG